MFPEVDPLLGPEMRSTGEVLGLSADFGDAFYKAQEATKSQIPTEGCVLISVNDRDKAEVVEVAQGFHKCGFSIMATGRTYETITEAGIPAEKVWKIQEGRPNILDKITNGKIQLIVNTPIGKERAADDSYIRKAAVKNKIPYMTTMAAAMATVEAIRSAKRDGKLPVKSLQEFHAEITDK
jgi:carbamoyl-phosphate synthase large subunit